MHAATCNSAAPGNNRRIEPAVVTQTDRHVHRVVGNWTEERHKHFFQTLLNRWQRNPDDENSRQQQGNRGASTIVAQGTGGSNLHLVNVALTLQ